MQYSGLGSMGNKGGRYIDELASCMLYRDPWKEIGYTTNATGGYTSNHRLDRINELDIVWPTVECVRNSFTVSSHFDLFQIPICFIFLVILGICRW
jgi:hypothetical protein